MVARLLFLLALLSPFPAAAQSLDGSWTLAMDGTAIFRFDLSQDDKGDWHGTWSRPSTFASDGDHFRRVSGPVKEVHSATGITLPNDTIEVSFDDPRPGAIPDIFDFRLIDPDAVRMTYVGTGLAPYTLERVKPGAALGPWDSTRTYGREGAANEPDKPTEPAVTFTPLPVAGTPPPTVKGTPPPGNRETPPPDDTSTFKLPPGAPVGR